MTNSKVTVSFLDNRLAQTLYDSLKTQGVSDEDLDAGFRITNYSGEACQTASDTTCLIGQHDGTVAAEEVMEYVFDRYETYQSLIETTTRHKLPWVLNVTTKQTSETDVQKRLQTAVTQVKRILEQQGLKEGTPPYREGLALSLYFLVTVPNKEWISEYEQDFLERTKELQNETYRPISDWLKETGGLRTDETDNAEYTALEALEKKQGECTEMSYILFALFKMAGFSPVLYSGDRAGMISVETDPERIDFLKRVPAGYGHMLVGLAFDDKVRFFDPAFIKSAATYVGFFPLTPRQGFAAYLSNIAKSWGDKEEKDKAQELYQLALAIDPRTMAAIHGTVEDGKSRDSQKNIALFSRAIDINPHSAGLYYSRGISYKDVGEFEKAIQDYSRAIKLDPNMSEAYINRGVVYGRQERWDDAIADFSKVLEINPNFGLAELNIGKAWLKKYDEVKAIQAFNRFLKISDAFDYFLVLVSDTNLAKNQAKTRHVEARKIAFEKDTGLDLTKIDLLFLCVFVLWKAKDQESSLKMLKMILDFLGELQTQPSSETHDYFKDVFQSLPPDMLSDSQMKPLIEALKSSTRYKIDK